MDQVQRDVFAKGFYRFILSAVIDRMASHFDREMNNEAEMCSIPIEENNIIPTEDNGSVRSCIHKDKKEW